MNNIYTSDRKRNIYIYSIHSCLFKDFFSLSICMLLVSLYVSVHITRNTPGDDNNSSLTAYSVCAMSFSSSRQDKRQDACWLRARSIPSPPFDLRVAHFAFRNATRLVMLFNVVEREKNERTAAVVRHTGQAQPVSCLCI